MYGSQLLDTCQWFISTIYGVAFLKLLGGYGVKAIYNVEKRTEQKKALAVVYVLFRER